MAWLVAILVFGVLIAFHEYGHMWAAKRMGMRVDRFSIGFGPVILSFRRGETEYAISAIPFGGYVAIAGMADEEHDAEGEQEAESISGAKADLGAAPEVQAETRGEHAHSTLGAEAALGQEAVPVSVPPSEAFEPSAGAAPLAMRRGDPRSFVNKKPWQQAFVLVAGPGANYLLAFLIGIPLLMFAATRPATDSSEVGFVEKGGPASVAGLEEGDRILEVAGVGVGAWEPLREALAKAYFASPDEPVPLRVQRGSETLALAVSPTPSGEDSVLIGIGPAMKKVPGLPFGAAFVQAGKDLWTQSVMTTSSLGRMISGTTKAQLSGPIGILGHTADQAKKGLSDLMHTVWLISVALGFFNLLPIPALDGGRLMFVAYEAITRRPVNQKIAGIIHASGFVALLLLLVVVSYGDIMRRFVGS